MAGCSPGGTTALFIRTNVHMPRIAGYTGGAARLTHASEACRIVPRQGLQNPAAGT